MDCCQVDGLRRVFRGRPVNQEVKAFTRHGPNARQTALLAALGKVDGTVEDARVLDIGGGIGVLALSLLARGASAAQLVEVSPAYLRAARTLAAGRGVAEQLELLEGDFVTLSGVAPADIVTLDRVVCCYPDADALLGKAAHKSRRWLLFTYPSPSWLTRFFRGGLNGLMRVLGWSYRFYLHDETRLLAAAQRAGHRLVARRDLGVWRLVVLERQTLTFQANASLTLLEPRAGNVVASFSHYLEG